MLRRHSEQIQRARHTRPTPPIKAQKAVDPRSQREWLAIERSWLRRVYGYELSERIQTCLAACGPRKKIKRDARTRD